jgi:hemolysin activation/secretion protein
VRLRVVMGRLAAIRVRGDAGRAERTIARYLDRLTQEEVFNTFAAERYLLLAGDLPGYDVRLALRPSPGAPGDLLGEVAVVRTSAEADFTLQNYGSEALGPIGGLVRAQLYGLTGLGDRTTISAFTTIDFHEQQTLQLGHDFRLGAEGLTLAGDVVYSWGRPDVGDANIEIDARTLIANFEASYPFVRRQTATLRGSVGFDYIDQAVDINELQLTRDRLRVAYARLDLQAFDPASNSYLGGYTPFEPRWRLAGTLEVRQGLDVLDASTDCRGNLAICLAPGVVPPSRIEADPTAALVRAQAYGEFRPHSKVAFSLGARAQVANEPLLSFEEFSAGNFTVGRGYDPGTILGDSGLGFQAEFRVGSIVPRTRDDLALQPYIFADTAWVWNQDPSLTGANPQELSSIGAGIRAGWGNRLRFDAAVAVPMERAGFQTERGDVRLLFNITTLLLPWSF